MENIDKRNAKIHKESFFMHEKTKKECLEHMTEAMNPDGSKRYTQEQINEKMDLLQQMQDDVKNKFIMSGGDINELNISNDGHEKTTKVKNKVVTKKTVVKKDLKEKNKKPITKKTKEEKVVSEIETAVQKHRTESTPVVPVNWSSMNFSESFDVIPLPSRGQCYDNQMSTIAVSYLTANDENMIVSPNLYRDGLILDYILRAKIQDKTIDPDDLLEGDREAIILWLRATGYGTSYPITVTDNQTGIEFDTLLDLSQIKHKPFVLEGDENGYFDFTLPNSKHTVKFRFLTHGDIKQIEEIENEEMVTVKKQRLVTIAEELGQYLENETLLNKEEKTRLYEAKRNINKWTEKLDVSDDLGYTHKLTNRLELSIVSINGNTDREYIADYVCNMNTLDALSLRKYITENEPGLDYAVTVERPESLGGGSMPVFLSLDEYVFLNIA